MMKSCSKKLAFTMAEILLAMVILGIIFLLSVNTLQHSSQEREKSSQLMKLYPIMDNMINLIVLENMGIENIPFGEGDEITDKFSEMLVKKLRVGENCQKNKDGCWATVADIPEEINDDFYKVRLVDGTALAIKTYADTDIGKCTGSLTVDGTEYNKICMVMYADVNALDKPNKWEEDVFRFIYTLKETKENGDIIEEGFYPASKETIKIVEKPKESTK